MKLSGNAELKATQERIAANIVKGKARLRGENLAEVIRNDPLAQNPLDIYRRNTIPAIREIQYSRQRLFCVRVEPMGAPRMTRSDKWRQPARPCVQRYWDYRDDIRAVVGDVAIVPDGIVVRAFIPMPASWSKKKKEETAGKPHRVRPDHDNISKGILDAIFAEDGAVWMGYCEKRWCHEGEGYIEITFLFA